MKTIALFLFVSICTGCSHIHNTTTAQNLPQEFTFPKDFLWGAALSSHQCEGNNFNNDWWQWEKHLPKTVRSGLACDHWNRFEEDFKLAQSLGHNAHRFSLEWSRIEPQEGQFDSVAINHYRKVIHSLKNKGIMPIVTLNHFSIPLWFAKHGGWLQENSAEIFADYVQKMAEELGADVHYWITINEPTTYAYKSYLVGDWPPAERSLEKAAKVIQNLAKAHALAYEKIKQTYAQKNWQNPMVGIAQQAIVFAPCSKNSIGDRISANLRNKMINHLFVRALVRGKLSYPGLFNIRLAKAKTLDFIGLNYYTREYVRYRGLGLSEILGNQCILKDASRNTSKKNSLSWEVYPRGLYIFLKEFAKYKLPILISENGMCTNDDSERSEFITAHLKETAKAMNEKVVVIGYLYWSLLDNYEWSEGFAPRFGLIEVDYKTQERKIRSSAKKFEEIIRSKKLNL